MTNGVDPSVNAMKAPGAQPHLDGPICQADPPQLVSRHNAVLPFGELGNPEIVMVRSCLTTYDVGFFDLICHGASVAAAGAPFSTRM